MNAHLTTTDIRNSSVSVEEFGRLALALVLSAVVHLLLAQFMPQLVKPYDAAPSVAGFALTVTLQPMAPERPRVPVPVPILHQPRTNESVDIHTPIDQAALSLATAPEAPRDVIPPDKPSPADQPALPLLDYYYSSREVDEPAKAVGDALLVYPREALRLRVSGSVKLRLFIDELGTLIRSEVMSADPPGIFEEAAVDAVKTMRFSAARMGEHTVRSQRTVQITFDPHPLQSPESTTAR
jgi:protein TonB